MDWITALSLVGAGLAAGFVAGLVGLGGGVVFAPVLLFFFRQAGVPPELVSKMTAGSSLFCTLVAAAASAWHQEQRNGVVWRVVGSVGLFSAAGVFLTTRFVTTQPWYDQAAFQVVFSLVLVGVVVRMVRKGSTSSSDEPARRQAARGRWPVWGSAGAGAGAVAAAAGVGGGIVLVPLYHRFLRLPMRRAVGTSSATIVLISLVGVSTYAATGGGVTVPGWGVGYVDVGHALLLAIPSVLTAQLGVHVAHRIQRRALQWSFAAVALVVVARMLYGALG